MEPGAFAAQFQVKLQPDAAPNAAQMSYSARPTQHDEGAAVAEPRTIPGVLGLRTIPGSTEPRTRPGALGLRTTPALSVSAGGGAPDASLDAAELEASLLGVYDPFTSLGDLDSGGQDIAYRDVSSKGGPDFLYLRTGDAAADKWTIIDTDSPALANPRQLNTNRRSTSGAPDSSATIASAFATDIKTVIVLLKNTGQLGFEGIVSLETANSMAGIAVNEFGTPFYFFYHTSAGYGSTGSVGCAAATPAWHTMALTYDTAAPSAAIKIWATALGGTIGDIGSSASRTGASINFTGGAKTPRIGPGQFDNVEANRDDHRTSRFFFFDAILPAANIQTIIDAIPDPP